jgi:hypothetical protein
MKLHVALLVALFSLIASLAAAGTASATEPTRETIQLVSRTTNPCPDGTALIGVFDVTREITTFYDADGTPIRQLWVASFDGTWTNPLTGASLPNTGIRIFHRDLVTGEFFTTGDRRQRDHKAARRRRRDRGSRPPRVRRARAADRARRPRHRKRASGTLRRARRLNRPRVSSAWRQRWRTAGGRSTTDTDEPHFKVAWRVTPRSSLAEARSREEK